MIKLAILEVNRKEHNTKVSEELIYLVESGLNIHHKDNIISSLQKLSKQIARAFSAYFAGDEEKSKELFLHIGRQELLKFLLLLDLGTLHIISNILHTIDAWTGWEIWHEVEGLLTNANDNIEHFIELMNNIEDDIKIKYNKKVAKKVISTLSTLRHQLTR